MKNLLSVFALLTTALALSVSCARAQPSEAGQTDLQALIESYVENRGFSGAVLVAERGEVLSEGYYGDAIAEWGVPNSARARYRIGSLSKPMTATLVMALAEDGVLSLEGTLGTYLPDLYAETEVADVTVAQLLSHTSGLKDLPGNFNDPWYQTIARHTFTPEALASELIEPVLISEASGTWRYNNAGFLLLGVIVERVTGLTYAENLQMHVFDPAGMTQSGVFSDDAVLPNLARGYARQTDGTLAQPLRLDTSILYSAAGLYTTARDWLRFDSALYGGDLVSAETRALMLTQKTDFPYGYGWGKAEWPMGEEGAPVTFALHTGSIPGYQSFYLRAEETERFVLVINNHNDGSIVLEMGRALMQAMHGQRVELARRNLADLLVPIALNEGAGEMIAAYEALGERRAEYDTSEGAINRLGYKLVGLDLMDAAIAVFELNVEAYPQSANTHDSLGEALRKVERIDEAIASYERALDLDPDSPSASAALEEMRAKTE